MFKSLPKQSVRIFALGALLTSIPMHILSLPDILNPGLKTISEALKARNPKFIEQLCDAMDMSDRELCENRHEVGSPEQTVLAWRPTRTIGEVAQFIKNSCNEDIECIENKLNGELGEFINFMLNPKRLRKENSATHQRFRELYNKYAEELDLLPLTVDNIQAALAKTSASAPSQPQATSVPTPVKTQVNWQPEQNFLQDYDLTAQRLATFMRIVAANVNDQPDEQLRTDWNNHIKNAQRDAKNLYDTYCPYIMTRRLSNLAAYATLGLSRLFSPSWKKCDACDTLQAIVDGNVFKEAENKATLLAKGNASAFKTWSNKSGRQQVAEATKLPMEAMLNPATLASTVMN